MPSNEVIDNPKIAIPVQEAKLGNSLEFVVSIRICIQWQSTYDVLHILELSEGLITEGEVAVSFLFD